MKYLQSIVLGLIACTSIFAQEETTTENKWSSNRPDGHAPIGVMADHVHHKGEFMMSYRFMNMGMNKLKQEDNNISNTDALNNYMAVPENMSMNMHMLGAMYAPSDKITLMAMANYIENDMNLQMKMMGSGMPMMTKDFSTQSGGFGDVSLSALYSVFNKNRKSLHTQLGVSIPTGSIEEKDVTPMSMNNEIQLPYPMQLGTGSWGIKAGVTYLWQNNAHSFGAQINGHFNLNENDQDYTFGNQYNATTWVAIKANNWFSVSLRLNAQLIEEIDGASTLLNPMMVTTADTMNSGGFFAHYGFGINLLKPNGFLKGMRLGAEVLLPVFQKVNGIQLDRSNSVNLGLQYAFH
jgi:hypothetical protein